MNSKHTIFNAKNVDFTFKKECTLEQAFGENKGFIGFGGYLRSENDFMVKCCIGFTHNQDPSVTEKNEFQIRSKKWNKIGVHKMVNIDPKRQDGKIIVKISMVADTAIGGVDFFGFSAGTVDYYKDKTNLKMPFNQQTAIYLPEIYYFNIEEPFQIKPLEFDKYSWTDGGFVILKSCNRCARFLLIDYQNQDNDIAFSLHCKSRAPCVHSTFAKYKILEKQIDFPVELSHQIQMHYGYQLECRPCKKFYVNHSLNPLRNSTQHREDSLRRRAFEDLAASILNRRWIFHQFRINNKNEFDEYIFKKFNKKCFNCEQEMKMENEMALDHTFPISMLWPLDQTATCLCKTCNSSKGNKFPVDFYDENKLKMLAKIIGISEKNMLKRPVNVKILEKLKTCVVWFFDKFLMKKDYQKLRDGKLAADNVYRSLLDVIAQSGLELDLVKEYKRKTGTNPKSITIT